MMQKGVLIVLELLALMQACIRDQQDWLGAADRQGGSLRARHIYTLQWQCRRPLPKAPGPGRAFPFNPPSLVAHNPP